jgi:hypothetical protein
MVFLWLPLFSGVIFSRFSSVSFFLVLRSLQSCLFNLMKGMNTKAVRGTKASRRWLELLLTLAEIQKTDLSRTGGGFVGIREDLSPPSPFISNHLYQKDPRIHIASLEHEL